VKHGLCEGDICNRNGCSGEMIINDDRNCSCHISPPCNACVEEGIKCDECGEFSYDEFIDDKPQSITDALYSFKY
jgi:hypothetical protein